MQEKINSFNAAFVDLAAGYVNRVAIRAAQKEPEPKGAAQQFRHELANEIQLANLLAATIGKMQAASGGEFPQDEQEDGKPHTAAGNMEFLRDFLEGKTRWNFPEGTVFNVNTSTGDGAAVQLKPEADGEPEQTAEREAQPGFICFSSAATENGEDPEKAPSVSVIMRVERMDVDEKTLLCLKRIQQKAAAEVNALLGW